MNQGFLSMGVASLWLCWAFLSPDLAGDGSIPAPAFPARVECAALAGPCRPEPTTSGLVVGSPATAAPDRGSDDAADLEGESTDDENPDELGLPLIACPSAARKDRLAFDADPICRGFRPSCRSPLLRC